MKDGEMTHLPFLTRMNAHSIFPDALIDLIKIKYWNFSIPGMMKYYAPKTENDTKRYIKFLQKMTGVTDDKKIKNFTAIQFKKLWQGTAQDKNTDYAQQIWIYDVKSKKQKVLVHANFACNDPEKQILDPQELKFSPDGKKLYFMTTGWVTSAALHVVSVDGKQEHYLIPANDYSIIPKGQYKGYIIAWQHRYFIAPGSYNWDSLYAPSGKKIGSLGKEVTKDQMDYLESK